MAPSKREASSLVSPTSEKPSKKHRPLDYGGPATEAPAAITPQGPLRNRHLQAVINAAAAADGADHSLSNGHSHHHQNGHHTPVTTTITQVFNNSSLSSPITVTSNSNSSTPNSNLNVSKRRSIVNLNRSARKDLTSYATKEHEMTPGGGGTPGTPNDQQGDETPTPTLSRVEYKNNLKSLHEIMSKSFDPKRAFNYNFINIMSSFINNDQGNIDFKLIALSLDAGTRVWTSKVDVVYRNTQKVSNSLSMATGDERAGGGGANFDDDEEGLFENSFLRNEKKKAAAKKRRKMAPTIVANTDTINGKLEMNIAVDPLFHHFSAAFDVGNVNSMLMTNLASDPAGVLLLDSAEMLNFDDAYKQQEKQPQPPTTVDLSAFKITLGSGGRQRDLESEEYGGGITVCPPMGDFDITDFSFNDRDASIDHLVSGSMTSPMKSSAFPATGGPYDGGQGRPSFEFDIDAPVDDVDVGDDDYGGDHDGDGVHHSGDEEGGGAHGKDHPQANQLYNQLDASLLEANMMDILPANKNEFFNKNFLRQVFRKVAFFKQGAGRSLLNGPGLDETTADGSSAAAAAAAAEKAARPKRTRPTFEENTYAASKEALEELFEPPTQEVKDSLSFALPTLNRWSINSELMHMKDDYGFETRHLKALFTKPDTYFNDLQRELRAQLGGGGATTSGAAATGIEDYGDDDFGAGGGGGASDYEDDGVGGGAEGGGTGAEDYNYERPLPDFNIADDYRSQAQSGATGGGGEPELNGHVDPLDIDYCRVAKKVDMKRVKRGMWDIIKESTTTELLSTDDPSQPASEAASSGSHGLTFSSLRQILPNHIRANLNENLSLHTSFVALLHLCNDKDLALAPITADDHSDFVIMKPTAAD
ncbi:hypothetical protein TYRP_015507 [Tyrophagus putrescentiae]|nr:hypothetical protein TYRP_015507 [Tyrophagus putrescentiae]